MKEVRIVIINDDSNTTEEFKGEDMLKQASIYLSKLAGLILFEKTDKPAINIDKPMKSKPKAKPAKKDDKKKDNKKK